MTLSSFRDAFTDRRDITEERTGSINPGAMDLFVQQVDKLTQHLIQAGASPNISEEFIVCNPGSHLSNTRVEPAPGIIRTVVTRSAIPPSNITIPSTGAIIFVANPMRLGGVIVNTGANPLQLVLGIDLANVTGAPQGGVGQTGYGTLWLSSSGGSWDFRLSDLLWGGSVYGYATTGSTTIAGVEV